MKTRKQKQDDLNALTEQFKKSNTALVIGFNKLTVSKDQQLRNQLREIGVKYQVVKNKIAGLAVKDEKYAEELQGYLKGMTGIAFSENDPVTLSKTLSKFVKDNAEIFSFKVGLVEGKVVDLKAVEEIASLPSKEVLISKIMYLINCQSERLVTVINAVPQDLASVVKQIADKKGE